ncbi:MAG: hypothetical protein IJ796_09235 [Lachnospiraceae bacterium]|nr:hypothetical protein [Lachnospiraceae bacterium]
MNSLKDYKYLQKESKLAALDPSSTCTGVSLFIDGELKYTGALKCPVKECSNLYDRINLMGGRIIDRLEEIGPGIVVVEKPFYKSSKVLSVISELLGITRGYCISKGIEFHEYFPTDWRKGCLEIGESFPKREDGKAFRREEWKRWAVSRIEQQYNITVNDDMADSILLGKAFLNEKINFKEVI